MRSRNTPLETPAEVSAYPPALLQRVAEIENRLSTASETEVRAMVDAGRDVQEILADSSYGVSTFKEVSRLFRTGRDTLRPGYVLATKYTDNELGKLFKLRNSKTGAGLHRAHLAVLSRITDKAAAFEMAERVVAEGLTRQQLVAEVTATQGKKSKGGRPRKPPGSLRELVQQISTKMAEFHLWYTKVWNSPSDGFLAKTKSQAGSVDAATATAMDELLEVAKDFGMSSQMIVMETYRVHRELFK
jgi:hypothetical protein